MANARCTRLARNVVLLEKIDFVPVATLASRLLAGNQCVLKSKNITQSFVIFKELNINKK